MCSALGLPDSAREAGAILFRRAHSDDLIRGRSLEAVASAAVYAAARLDSVPRTFQEIGSVSRVGIDSIKFAYNKLNQELKLPINLQTPDDYIPRFCTELDCSRQTETLALEIATSGFSPIGLAAAAIYTAANCRETGLTQSRVADTTDITTRTIQKRHRDFKKQMSLEELQSRALQP
jgi:transcription initiation factor TFIIB